MGSPASIGDERPVILFDGVCNLCNGAVQFIIKRDQTGKFRFASLQSPAAAEMLTGMQLRPDDIYSILVLKNGKLYDRSDAIIEISKDLPGVWRAIAAAQFLPKVIRDGLYKIIANNRYRIFGKQESCMLPTPELKSRFLA